MTVGEYVLHKLLPLMKEKSGVALYPAYSIVVEYLRGMDLLKHYDQNRWSELACVILMALDGTET